MNIINLTPHAINFITEVGTTIIQPSGTIARLSTKTVVTGEINGIPVTETVFGDIENLPAPETDTIYIVSSLIAGRCKDRNDIFIPNESVRDGQGNIIGCKSLGRI